MNYRLIAKLIGNVLCIEGLAMAAPFAVALIYNEGDSSALAVSALVCLIAGGILRMTRQIEDKRMHTRDGFAAVALCWIVLAVFGAAPYVLSGAIPNPVSAFFESVSGFTTTGATVVPIVERLPHGILFWRSLTQWIGGIGIMALSLALLTRITAGSGHLLEAEETGPVIEKLSPKLGRGAKMLCALYSVLTLLCFISLSLAGLDLFNASTTAMSTVATGGFSVHTESIGFYASPIVGSIVIVFMLLSSISYPAILWCIRKKFSALRGNHELRLFAFLILVSIVAVVLNLRFQAHYTVGENFYYAVFQSVAAATTTAYYVTDPYIWPAFTKAILLLLMIIGGCAGSSAGGVKVVRILVMVKMIRSEINKILHPNLVKCETLSGKAISGEVYSNIFLFFFAFCMIIIVSALAVSFDDFGVGESLSMAIAAACNDGAAVDVAAAQWSYAFLSAPVKLVLCAAMFMGRLEIWPFIVLFFPSVWKNK